MEKETLPLPAGKVFNHAASLLQLPDGTLLAAWSSGSKEKSKDTAIVLSFKKPGSRQWSQPQVLIDTPNKADGNPVIFLLGDEIHCFYSSLLAAGWSTARLFHTKSTMNQNKFGSGSNDINFLWAPPKRIFPFYRIGDLARSKPVILGGEEFILPLYKEFSGYYSYVCKFAGEKIVYHAALIMSRPGNLQPAVILLSNGDLLMLMRPEDRGHFWQSFSKDTGKTWSRPEQRKDLSNPDSGFDLLKLASGNIILLFNDSSRNRNNLTIALSENNEVDFSVKKILEEEKDVDFGYPSATQDSNGKIHIIYSVNKEKIRHIVIDEEEVFKGKSQK
ncbi:MAG: exo-alpha-sialidase [Candidatus Ratteibacteria bacterium]|nr:exo-alpha-sialidase [Candidatus Ratteibacteria bacterium]